MDDETFNMSMRKFLKQVGVTSQQAIEKLVRGGGLGLCSRVCCSTVSPLGLMRLGFILMLVAAIVGLKFVSH